MTHYPNIRATPWKMTLVFMLALAAACGPAEQVGQPMQTGADENDDGDSTTAPDDEVTTGEDDGDGQTTSVQTTTGQTSDVESTTDSTATATTSTVDSSEDETQEDGTPSDEESMVPTSCADEENALYSACANREAMEFYVREGTTNPCASTDYCGFWACQDEWTEKTKGIRKPCDAKYPLCAELYREYEKVFSAAFDTCATKCNRIYGECMYDHYCAVGGPENADPEVTMKCSSDLTVCNEGCAPLPPSPPTLVGPFSLK